MSKKTGTLAAVVAGIALVVWSLPAMAQEPTEQPEAAIACEEHDEASTPHHAMEDWMTEMDGDMTSGDHSMMHDMMTMMHGEDHPDGTNGPPMIESGSTMSSGWMRGESMASSGSWSSGSMMGGGS